MNDQEAIEFFKEKLKHPTKPSLVSADGTVKILGFAIKRMLQNGPPVYFVAYEPKMAIYDFAYDEEDLLERCRFVVRKKKCDPSEVGFGKINGQQLFNVSIAGGLHPGNIQAERFYNTTYTEVPNGDSLD